MQVRVNSVGVFQPRLYCGRSVLQSLRQTVRVVRAWLREGTRRSSKSFSPKRPLTLSINGLRVGLPSPMSCQSILRPSVKVKVVVEVNSIPFLRTTIPRVVF